MHSIYFARHGETVWNVENKICGMTDSPLTEKGRQQARELGRKVKESGVHISALANTKARPGTAQSFASPRPILPTATTAARA